MYRTMRPKLHASNGMQNCGGVRIRALPFKGRVTDGCSFGAGAAEYKIHLDTRLNKKNIAILPYSMLEYLTRQYGGVAMTFKVSLFTSTPRTPWVSRPKRYKNNTAYRP